MLTSNKILKYRYCSSTDFAQIPLNYNMGDVSILATPIGLCGDIFLKNENSLFACT